MKLALTLVAMLSLTGLLPQSAAAQEAPTAPVPAPASAAQSPAANPDRSTPEATVRSFVTGLNRLEMATLVACVEGATLSKAALDLGADLQRGFGGVRFVVEKVTPKPAEDGRTVVLIEVKASLPESEEPQRFQDTLEMKKEGDLWKIVTPDPKTFDPRSRTSEALSLVSMLARYPEVFLAARARALEQTVIEATLGNIRQINVALLMLKNESGGQFKLKPETLVRGLMPYLKSAEIFTSPLDDDGTISFRFNPKLAGVAAAKVKKPAETVMLYEGEWKKPTFRYGGKAAVGLVDGSAKMVTPEEAAKLSWTP